ncbi:hypothetical protein [Phytoactinopolyspora halotolerans]|uniref:Uncharacterized protein n=1 Tax=Phytoactinopolyspora halotolerans TaxID=1981512 RepID=A0A6L9SCS4_9ACTN|nr:hypothetical protein [Phytoactinopolyspora halotolerans]NEE02809.1 hypothetical protein [Phytoactinopolyspora halotolerans]
MFATVMGWFVAKGRTYPSLVACVVGATVGITLGSLVVPTSNDRIAADTDLVTTHTASTPSNEPTTESTGARPQSPEERKPSGTGTPRATADDQPPESRNQADDRPSDQGADGSADAPDQSGSQDSSGDDDSNRTDDESDTQDDAPDETSSEAPDADQNTPDRSPPQSSDEPEDDPDSEDQPDEPDQPDKSDEPDVPDDSEEPQEPERSAPPTMDTDIPEPIPTDPEEREKYCLGLDLSLLELLLCLG